MPNIKAMLPTLLCMLSLFVVSPDVAASQRADIAWKSIDNGALLIDVRTPEEYQIKHLDNSVNLPLNTINYSLDSINKDREIVVYCRSGNRSGQAKAYLEKVGFTNVHNGGGLEEMIHAQQN